MLETNPTLDSRFPALPLYLESRVSLPLQGRRQVKIFLNFVTVEHITIFDVYKIKLFSLTGNILSTSKISPTFLGGLYNHSNNGD